MSDTIKELHWIGSSKKDLMTMPDTVRRDFGHGLHLAQIGLKMELIRERLKEAEAHAKGSKNGWDRKEFRQRLCRFGPAGCR